jgi:hypothetical protein
MGLAMPNNIRPATPGQNIVPAATGSAVVNRWAQVIEVAQPTLDAIPRLRDARDWLVHWKNRDPGFNRLMLDPNGIIDEDEANDRLALLPEMAVLQDAAELFGNAVRKAAPEPWFFLAIGAMLLSMPNAKNVAPDYSIAIIDMLVHDHESWERDCQPGFSAPVFISALRQVRRETQFVPSAAEILEACKAHRKRFRQLESDVMLLIHVRENAVDHLSMWDESTFTAIDELELRKARRSDYVPSVDDANDCPF